MPSPNIPIRYIQASSEQWETQEGTAIVEAPINLTVNGESWLTFMCTPIDLEAMAVGYLYNEGLIQNAQEIADVRLCAQGDNVDVWLHHTIEKPTGLRRTSGCLGGLTASDGNPNTPDSSPKVERTLAPEKVNKLMNQLAAAQNLYRQSGGVHTSALSDGTKIIVSAEDIGRNNTLDKIAGFCVMNNIQDSGGILLTTGRISSEMLQKSAHIHASIIISRTAASSLAILQAEASGITLVGYTRQDRFTVYTHPQRILFNHKTKKE